MTTAKLAGFTAYTLEDTEIATNVLATITEEVLAEKVFTECDLHDSLKVGFSPFTDGSFILQNGASTAVQITTQAKKPKPSEVKRRCKKAENFLIKETGAEELTKEQKDDIKFKVVQDLLPETPADDEVTTLVWFTGAKVIVGAQSYKKGEELLSFLRMSIGSLPVFPLKVDKDVSATLTTMVDSEYCEDIALGEKVELETEEGAKITFAKGSVYDQDTDKHIKLGAVVTKLMLECDGVVFTINDKLEASGLKVSKDIVGKEKDEAANIIAMPEINRCVEGLVKVFGGLRNTLTNN
jgi:recombination associated protein RdgC